MLPDNLHKIDPEEAIQRVRALLSIDDMLEEEELAVRDVVRAFVADNVLPDIDKHFEDKTFPLDVGRRLGSELGLFGCALPDEHCGTGASYTAYGVANQELE